MKVLFASWLMLVPLVGAEAQGLLNTINLKAYCNQEGVQRQTLLYLDQSIISKTDKTWYKDILNRTKFFPGERVEVVTITDDAEGAMSVWDSCYPSFTESRYAREKEKEGFSNIFIGGIDDKLKDDKKAFEGQFNRALAHPLSGTPHQTTPNYSSNFPEKKLIEAFNYDEARVDLENGISRVIVFSDMIENSDHVDHSNFDPEKDAVAAAERYESFFNHATFYIYGIKYTNDSSALNEKMEKFWRRYLNASGAAVGSYGAQLYLPKYNEIFTASSYTGFILDSDGRRIAARLRLAYANDGRLIHSWLVLDDINIILDGYMICTNDQCDLTASVRESYMENGFQKGDVLMMTEKRGKLKGVIGSSDDTQVDEEANIFRFDAEFIKDSVLKM